MRFELRFPDGDTTQDPLLKDQIQSAVSFVSQDAAIDLVALPDDDPRLGDFVPAIIVVVRSIHDGAPRMRRPMNS